MESSKKSIRLFKPLVDKNDVLEFQKVFEDQWLGLGSSVYDLESQWSQTIGNKFSIATNSATSALHLACESFKFPAESEILVPSLTFVSSVTSIIYSNLRPVFVDICPVSLNLDINLLSKYITAKTKAILVVHYGGEPAKMDALCQFAKDFNLRVIEDCAHTQGGSYLGKKLGTWGDIGCFSFEEKKGMTTGDGGMLITDSEEINTYVRKARWLGIDKDTWSRADQKGAVARNYIIDVLGFKYNMNNLAASLGLAQLKKLSLINSTKTKYIKRYLQTIKKCNRLQALLPYSQINSTDCSYWLFGVRTSERDALISFLDSKGISHGIHFTPINEQPYFKKFAHITPVASSISKKILTLPLSAAHTLEEIEYVCDALEEFDSEYVSS